MTKYKMPVTWIADGIVKVEADTLDEAADQIENGKVDFPDESQNIIGTMQVDFERVEELNPGFKLNEL